jgi:hypothetical protein
MRGKPAAREQQRHSDRGMRKTKPCGLGLGLVSTNVACKPIGSASRSSPGTATLTSDPPASTSPANRQNSPRHAGGWPTSSPNAKPAASPAKPVRRPGTRLPRGKRNGLRRDGRSTSRLIP